jgi:hypothetical protein
MSLINEYRATEEAIKELQARLKNLSQDDKLQTELEFEGKLRTLMGEYSKSLRDIIALLDPEPKPKHHVAVKPPAPSVHAKLNNTKPAQRRSHRNQRWQPQDSERVESQVGRRRG